MTLTPIADDFPAIAAATNDAQMYADIRQMAEIPIVPILEFADWKGADRATWHQWSEKVRKVAVVASMLMTKDAAALQHAAATVIDGNTLEAWTEMLDAFDSSAERLKSLFHLMEAASARGLVALALVEVRKGAP
jgi:hypothetical protein